MRLSPGETKSTHIRKAVLVSHLNQNEVNPGTMWNSWDGQWSAEGNPQIPRTQGVLGEGLPLWPSLVLYDFQENNIIKRQSSSSISVNHCCPAGWFPASLDQQNPRASLTSCYAYLSLKWLRGLENASHCSCFE